MFSRDTLTGIFLSIANTEIIVERNNSLQIGYRVKKDLDLY